MLSIVGRIFRLELFNQSFSSRFRVRAGGSAIVASHDDFYFCC
jgi:hypothetical protein